MDELKQWVWYGVREEIKKGTFNTTITLSPGYTAEITCLLFRFWLISGSVPQEPHLDRVGWQGSNLVGYVKARALLAVLSLDLL